MQCVFFWQHKVVILKSMDGRKLNTKLHVDTESQWLSISRCNLADVFLSDVFLIQFLCDSAHTIKNSNAAVLLQETCLLEFFFTVSFIPQVLKVD